MSNTEHDDRIDFSALDPARDTPRWEERIAAVTARAVAARQRPRLVDDLRTLGRPALLAAAAIALLVWGTTWLHGRTPAYTTPAAGPRVDPVAQVVSWSRGDGNVNPYELLEVAHGE